MRTQRHDRGSITLIALVVLVIGGSAIAGLTAFDVAILRAQAAREQRTILEHQADAALELTTAVLRRNGVDPSIVCPDAPTGGESGGPSAISTSVTITCTAAASSPAPSATTAGLITTLHGSSVEAQQIPVWAGAIGEAIDGPIVITTGSLSIPGISILPDRRTQNGQAVSVSWESRSQPWSSAATSLAVDQPGTYPPLPPVPLFERPGSQASIGACTIYFPGRYPGTTSLVLSGGLHYFTSGVYYFERNLTISNGARVVMGSGRHQGCTNDLDAVATSRSPRRHTVEGRGATLLFGAAARLFVQNSSLIINSRSDDEQMSIRTVGFGTSTSTVAIPADVVRLDDGSLVAAASHTRLPPESATAVSYKASTLAPATDVAVSITLNGTNPETNRVIIDGRIFVPHGGLHIASTTSSYGVSLTGGIVTTRLTSSLPNAPSGAGTSFDLGFTSTVTTRSILTIDVTVSDGQRTFTALESYDADASSWTVLGRSQRHRRVHDG